jgi:hypothetical protein
MLNFLSPAAAKFKFKDLKTYASTDYFLDNYKNYRTVFDRYEVDYVYAEFSFYNKKMDVKDWQLKLNLKCFLEEADGRSTLICDLNFDRTVEKEDPVFYLREGWGNKEKGAFWKEGTYCWEVYIEGKKIATDFFHINEPAKECISPSSYIDVKSVHLYEFGLEEQITKDSIPYKVFSSETTRYLGVKVLLNNLLPKKRWFCELKMRIYHQNRLLKTEQTRLNLVKREDPTIEALFDWGSEDPGSWGKGSYVIELSFLDELIAVLPFEIRDAVEEGDVEIYINPQYQAKLRTEIKSETLTEFILKTNRSILVQKLANSEINLVIKELLSFTENNGLHGLTKKVVNLSAQLNRLSKNDATKVNDQAYNEINAALIDLVYDLDLMNLSEI